jgi:hypothetical protein
MLQIQATRDCRTSREGDDSFLCMVLHQEPSPTLAEGNQMRAVAKTSATIGPVQ